MINFDNYTHMIRKLLFFLLLPALTFGQSDWRQTSTSHHSGTGVPTKTGYSNGALYLNKADNTVYVYNSTTRKWVVTTDPAYVGEMTSGTGVKGDKGDQGEPGKDGVCPTCPPSSGGGSGVFPFNVVIDNGVDNRAAIQDAIDNTYLTGKPIWIIGLKAKISGGVVVPKDILTLEINATGILEATNSNTWTLFSSPVPANVQEAEGVYTNRFLVFRNIKFWGLGQKQTMFDLQCTEGAVYDNCEGKSLYTFIDNSFGLRSIIRSPEFVHCLNGIMNKSAAGKYPGATAENSAPNGTTITDARGVAASNTNVGILVTDCSECKIDGIVLEGDKWNIGVDWNCSSTTTTGMLIDRPHFEAAQPCGIAVFRITSSTMVHEISNPNLIKPSVLIQVVPQLGGNPAIKIRNSSNQRILFNDGQPPIFKTAAGVMWYFESCDVPLTNGNKIPAIFTGAPMAQQCNRENLNQGYSGYCFIAPLK